MEIINPGLEDFHVHTNTFSDGFNSIDEMVIWAGKIGIETLAITDHCQFYLDRWGFGKKTHRSIISRWKNVHNEVRVIFGIEADVMNEDGDVSYDIQGVESDFVILSAHRAVFQGDSKKITSAYIKAIERYASKITFISHICAKYFDQELEVDPIIDIALEKGIPFEFNCSNLMNNKTNPVKLRKVLSRASKLYVNSDAHTLNELQSYRKEGIRRLKELQLM